jgi:heptosyltransferase-3
LKALIIRPSALGDTLLLAPAFYQLTDKVELSLAGRRPGIDFLRPFLSSCMDFDRKGWHRLFLGEPLCEKRFMPDVDRVVSFVSDPGGKVNKALGKSFEHIPVFSFPPFPSREEKIHVALYLAICLKRSGLPVDPDKAVEEAKARPVISRDNSSGLENIVVLHPGSGSKKKNHPPEFWIELICNKDLEKFDKRILLLGPAEEELGRIFTSELSNKGVEIICSPHNDGLLLLLKKSSLYIGHDSGITHLAAMLGTPTICLFRNSNPLQWAPLGPHVTVIPDSKSRNTIFKKIKETLKSL